MTKIIEVSGFSEAHSSVSKKKYFCLPTFAASYVVRDMICWSDRSPLFHEVIPNKKNSFNQPKRKKRNKKRGRGKPNPIYDGVAYGSVSEAALGILLEQLIPDFSVKEGKTFQLPLGQGRTVDFLIENTLVEFHYPRTFSRGKDLGDFKDEKERRDFLRALSRVGRNRHQRKKLLRTTHELLIRNYTNKRRKQIDCSVYGPHTELIVASTPQEFYWKVICRFVGIGAISEAEFVEGFRQCCESVISCSKESIREAA